MSWLAPYALMQSLEAYVSAIGQSTVGPLFHDAMEAKSLRAQVRRLVSSSQDASERLRNSQSEAAETKALREQNQTLQKENREIGRLRNQVQLLRLDVTEISNLREQVQQLQRDALAKVERVRTVTDNKFAQDFRAIVAMIKSLSRLVCPSDDVNIFTILDSGILLSDVPVSHWNTRARKKSFIEAWAWSVLIEIVFMTPFAIFHDDGDRICELWSKMFDAENSRYWPTASTQAESWRCSTIEHLVVTATRAAITRGEGEQSSKPLDEGATHGVQRSVLLSRARVAKIIRARLSELAPGSDLSQIQKIVDKAFTLALEMSLQRSRLRVTHPAVGATFNKQQMLPMPDRSGKDIEDGTVAFVVNPGLVKWGDAEGRNLECRYDIIASLVQLKPFADVETMANEHEQAIIKVEPTFIKPEPEDEVANFSQQSWDEYAGVNMQG
jgi:hypothetical protein